MTCTNVPFDIQTSGATKCSLKCLLSYKYGDSACTILNDTTSLKMSYDGTSDVIYNSAQYTPTEIRIFQPSLHTYSGRAAVAELIIVHASSQGGLLICVPLVVSTTTTQGSYVVADIVAAAPTEGTSSASISDYNANYLIPTSTYYTYDGPLPYGPCSTQIFHYVVFHPKSGSLAISKTTLSSIEALISPTYIASVAGAVYVNTKGTSANGFAGDGQIYIDCQPTGQSEEEIVFKDTTDTNSPPSDMMMTILMILIGIILIYVTFRIMKLVLGKVSKVGESTGA